MNIALIIAIITGSSIICITIITTIITIEATKKKNRENQFLQIFGNCLCLLEGNDKEMITKRYNGKTRRVLTDQQLKMTQVKNRVSENIVSLFSQLCKKGTFHIFPLGASITVQHGFLQLNCGKLDVSTKAIFEF